MKTAMQEAIELVKEYNNRIIPYNVLLGNLELLLEKEKEQIRQAYIFGHYDSSLDIYNPSESYSQIINQ